MNIDTNKAHYLVSAVIIKKGNKYLIVKRSEEEVAFPGLWTVPGGKVEINDYKNREKDTKECWYNVMEKTLEREVKEEVGLHIKNIKYLTSMAFKRPDGVYAICLSFYADIDEKYFSNIKLCKDLTEYVWVTLDEARKYDLIDGIFEEIYMLDEGLPLWKKVKK